MILRMADPSTATGVKPSFREILDEATDFRDLLDRLVDAEIEGPDLVEILEAERHGGGYCPEQQPTVP